jgi:iron complex outermembrane receptor protein
MLDSARLEANMKLRKLISDASLVAMTLAAAGFPAHGQEALPTIEVGAARPGTPSGARPATAPDQAPQSPIDAVAQPPKEENDTYRPANAFSATKTNTPIMDTPASIQVVPREVLEDQKFTEISQAVNNVSGVIAPDGRQAFGSWIRGFLTYTYYKDGVRMDQNATNNLPNNVDVDRVEVLKGPASILFGHGEPGGLINLVTKQPLEKPYTAIETQIGSWNTYRTTLDTTGPLTKDNTLLYRLNAAWDDASYFIDNYHTRDYYFAPTLRWDIDPQTYLTLQGTFRKYVGQDSETAPALTGPGPNSTTPWWSFAWGTGGAPATILPRGQNLTQPWGRGNGTEGNAGFLFSHDLNEDWNIKERFHTQLATFTHFELFPASYTNNAPFELYTYPEGLVSSSTQSYYTSTELTGKVKTGFVDHTLFLGVDYQHFNEQGLLYFGALNGPTATINALFPSLTQTNFQPYLLDPTSRLDYGNHETWFGVSFQDQIKLPYNIFILAAGRYDHLRELDPTTNQVTTDAQRVTPRFGLLWRPIPEVSLYGSYLSNFGSLPATNVGAPLPPESAQQWEVGVKTELFDNKLTATIAYYDLTKQNIAYPVPTDPTGLHQLALGEARNRGFEFDFAGEILPGWKVIGGYSYIASEITKDAHCDPTSYSNWVANPFGGPAPGGCVLDNYSLYTLGNPVLLGIFGNEGKRLGGVPRNSGSLWTTYEFQDGSPLKGLKVGGGAVARSLAQGDNWNDYHLPGYATVQLMASYTTNIYDRKTTFQLNVDNLLDTRYIQISYPSAFAIENGAPRSFKGSIKVEF